MKLLLLTLLALSVSAAHADCKDLKTIKEHELARLDADYAALDKEEHTRRSNPFAPSKGWRESGIRDNITRDEQSLRQTELLIIESGCSVNVKN